MNPYSLTWDNLNYIYNNYRHMSDYNLSTNLGCSLTTIAYYRKRFGWHRSGYQFCKKKIDHDEIMKVSKLIPSHSVYDISVITNIPFSRTARIIRKIANGMRKKSIRSQIKTEL